MIAESEVQQDQAYYELNDNTSLESNAIGNKLVALPVASPSPKKKAKKNEKGSVLKPSQAAESEVNQDQANSDEKLTPLQNCKWMFLSRNLQQSGMLVAHLRS